MHAALIRLFRRSVEGLKRRVIRTHISLLALVRFNLLVGALIIVSISPLMRTDLYEWKHLGDWGRALAISWPAALGAYLVKFLGETTKRYIATRQAQGRMRRRSMVLSATIEELHEKVLSGNASITEIRPIREQLLQCAAIDAAQVISAREDADVVASLLEFADEHCEQMRIAARSMHTRDRENVFETEKLVSWEAIVNGKCIMVDDIKHDLRFGRKQKSYRTVLVLPVTRGNKAVGAIVLDHDIPYSFFGKSEEIEVRLQPYRVLLAGTFDQGAFETDCEYSAYHVTL